VTFFLLNEHPELFGIHSVTDAENNTDLRWTVDVPQDLEMVRRLYEELGLGERVVGYRELLAYVRAHPSVAMVNAGVMQKKVLTHE
jgi:spore coat polysaccharide biosynthesis protein SpsF